MVEDIHRADTEMGIVVSLAMSIVPKLFYIRLAKNLVEACLVLASCCLLLLQVCVEKEKVPIVHVNKEHSPNLILYF